jgi:putative hemolysin
MTRYAAKAPMAQALFSTLAPYTLRWARTPADLRAVQALRFKVFNLELREGLAASHLTGLDADPFDGVCDHLMVEDAADGCIVGTYRMQTGQNAAVHSGYYCEQEFEFSVYEPYRGEILELGRACIAKEHRSMQVLSLLWRGIADYANTHNARYLIGCSSLSSLDHAQGNAAYAHMQGALAPAHLQTTPHAAYRLDSSRVDGDGVHIPKLLSAYLALGAWICGPPALDRAFGTIDFLTCLDLQAPHMKQRRKRFGINA